MKRRGFTLIELVIVIAVLGILAGIAIPRFLHSNEVAKGAKVVDDLRTIDSAINIYAARVGTYPTSLDQLVTDDGTNNSLALLAANPAPPSGNFIVTQYDGTEQEFTDISAPAYLVSAATGRAYLGPDTSYTVDYYLGYAGNFGTYATDVSEAMKAAADKRNSKSKSLDSYAYGITGSGVNEYFNSGKVSDEVKAAIADLTSWHYDNKAETLTWTSSDIQSLEAGATVTTITYDKASGTYSVGTATVKHIDNVKLVAGSSTGYSYNYLPNGNSDYGSRLSYSAALTIYNAKNS